MICSHTSMFPGQLQHQVPGSDVDVHTSAVEMLSTARRIIHEERFALRFIVFPLFLAGFAMQDPGEVEAALSMLKMIERHSYGGSTESVRRLLERIYEKQNAAILRTGTASSVDLVKEMELSGQKIIIYRL